jgi:hypothetical protein
MKKISLIAALFVMAAFSVSAAPANVTVPAGHNAVMFAAPPAAVLKSFIAIFGNVPVREWKLRSDGNWRAHFTNRGILWEATFTPAGVLVKSERD